MLNSFNNNQSFNNNNQNATSFLNNSMNRDPRSDLAYRKNKNQMMKHKTTNQLNKIKFNSSFIRDEAQIIQNKLNASVFEEYNDGNRNNLSTLT